MDYSEYIGLPYKDGGRDRDGCDCWGLVRLVLAERFGVEVPSYAEGYDPDDGGRIEREVEAARPDWQEIPAGQERPGDVVQLRVKGDPTHFGLVISRGQMLHVQRGHNAVTAHYRGARATLWRHCVVGFFRWREGVTDA